MDNENKELKLINMLNEEQLENDILYDCDIISEDEYDRRNNYIVELFEASGYYDHDYDFINDYIDKNKIEGGEDDINDIYADY